MKLADGLTEIDLNGILFTEFPVELSLNESRERLELMVLDAYDRYLPESQEEPELTPFSVFLAIHLAERRRLVRIATKERMAIYEAVRERRRSAFERAKRKSETDGRPFSELFRDAVGELLGETEKT